MTDQVPFWNNFRLKGLKEIEELGFFTLHILIFKYMIEKRATNQIWDFDLVFSKFFFMPFMDLIFIFYFRERGREGERVGDKHQSVVSCSRGPNWQPGIKPVTFHFEGQCPAKPHRSGCFFLSFRIALFPRQVLVALTTR